MFLTLSPMARYRLLSISCLAGDVRYSTQLSTQGRGQRMAKKAATNISRNPLTPVEGLPILFVTTVRSLFHRY